MPYIGRSSDFGVRTRYYFTQTSGGATSISGIDDNGKRLGFTDGNYIDVKLKALSADDVIEITAYDVFNVADTVPASTGGEFSGGIEADRYQNADSFSEDFTIPTNKNALLVGPVTLTGTVTVNGTLTVV